jgi:hypothetical protein
MIMRYEYLTQHPNVFLSATGLRVNEFDQLIDDVQARYVQAEHERLSRPDRQRGIGGGQSAVLSVGDQILMAVVWLRLYPTNEVLGYLFGVSDSTVSRYVQRVVKVLEASGQDKMRMPDPGRKRRRTLDVLLKDTPELAVVIDSFEQKVQRPAQAAGRDALYSGKKKTHTLKSQVSVDEDTGQIVDVSDSRPGPLADVKLVEHSGVLQRLPPGVGAIGDCGYQGIHDLHPLAHSPRKKPRGKARPPQDVAYNTAFSRRRIIVENSIGRMRRYQAITQTDRHHRQLHSARVRAVAGLANRQLANRLPC